MDNKKKGLGLKQKVNISLQEVRSETAPVQEKNEKGIIQPKKKYTTFEIYHQLFLKWRTTLTLRREQMADFLNKLVDDFLENKLELIELEDGKKKLPIDIESLDKNKEIKKAGYNIDESKDADFKLKLRYYNISQREFFTCFIILYVNKYYGEVRRRMEE